MSSLPVIIIGGGPIGLAAAAQLAERQENFIVIEKGTQVGTNFLDYGHVRLFSPWKYNMDSAAKRLLIQHNVRMPDEEYLPFGKEIVTDYLEPLAQLPEIKSNMSYNSEVLALTRKGIDKVKDANRAQSPFVVQYKQNDAIHSIEARAVLDATGTWQTPNPIGSGGIAADGERDAGARLRYGIPDVFGAEKERYEGKQVAVVGSGHSAINTLLDLAQLEGKKPHWILRKKDVKETYGGMEDDALPGRGALGTRIQKVVESGQVVVHTPFFIQSLSQHTDGTILIQGDTHSIEGIDEIIAATGSRPNFDILREIRYQADPAIESVPELAELIDPNIHSCGTVRAHGEKELRQPEANFYIIGAKSYGRAPTFLMATGYEQARSVVAYLCGDIEAARDVQLNLPETGVCSANLVYPSDDNNQGECC
ncbi:NAD(P)-binding domain-containing protein [Pontibacillus salicampi]|uniref:NAD(P)-binding domain-containing protein n=1 Tax=Pontibacillus salicampi TaxID=1449801 RepID=A0ABV6LI42_9BACI